MFEIYTTAKFDRWLKKLRNRQAVIAITDRLGRIEALGQFGDNKQLSSNLWELRFFVGKGYRRSEATRRPGWLAKLIRGSSV